MANKLGEKMGSNYLREFQWANKILMPTSVITTELRKDISGNIFTKSQALSINKQTLRNQYERFLLIWSPDICITPSGCHGGGCVSMYEHSDLFT